MIKFVYSFVLPPGCFVLLLLGIAFGIRYREKKAHHLVMLVSFLLYALSTSLVGDILLGGLENQHVSPSDFDADVIVMTGIGAVQGRDDIDGKGQLSGSGANRLLTVARLQRSTQLPIILSGGQVFGDTGNESKIAQRQLLGLGISADKIILEDKSVSTKENAQFTKNLLIAHGFQKPLLVVSAFHMPRTFLHFQRQNIDAIPYPTDFQTSQQMELHLNRFAPSASALACSGTALREYLALMVTNLMSYFL